MLDIGSCLRHYKRAEIQEAMLAAAKDREVAVRYGEKGYGKRPDTVNYPRDILEFAMQGATSFHVSEERWSNIYGLKPELKREEQEALRKGWDLVIDIDCPDFGLSRIFAWLVVRSLEEHGVRSISIKFSGNKGFHIGVPFEAFPSKINDRDTERWFPDGPRRIAAYLVDYISRKHIEITNTGIRFGGQFEYALDKITELTGKRLDELSGLTCAKCSRIYKTEAKMSQFACVCGMEKKSDADYLQCERCGKLMQKSDARRQCECGSAEFIRKLNPLALMQVDTLLISSRHLYRMPYSLHEKSGLCSAVFSKDDLLKFERDMGKPDSVIPLLKFLDTSNTKSSEAAELVIQAFDYSPLQEEDERGKREFEQLTEAIPEEFFPPCIRNIRAGIDDGRKRALFIMVNFLQSTGYSLDKIDEILFAWNKNNREPLREVHIKGQLRYKKGHKPVMPPNCSNTAYYKDFGVCTPDSFCGRIRNPVNYSILKAKLAQGPKKAMREKLTEEQKEMRRQHRMKKAEQQ